MLHLMVNCFEELQPRNNKSKIKCMTLRLAMHPKAVWYILHFIPPEYAKLIYFEATLKNKNAARTNLNEV